MTEGWQPLSKPNRPKPTGSKPAGREAFSLSPFVRLARVHACSAAGDAMITMALAGSLFFSIDPSAARWRVGLYLLFTMAPFALVSPFIGPAIDRAKGGRRMMIVIINALRVIVAMLMIGNLDNLLLFPLAFGILVLQKGFAVARAAIVPTTVSTPDQLVERNARMSLLAGLSGFIGVVPAFILQWIAGPGAAVFLAMLTFAAAFFLSFQLPKTVVAADVEGATERAQVRSGPILLAASSMGILRGVMGFFSFLVAFGFRGGTDDVDLSGPGKHLGGVVWSSLLDRSLEGAGVSAFKIGLIVGTTVIGGLLATLVAGRLRTLVGEGRIMFGALVALAVVALLGSFSGGLSGAMLVGLMVGMAVNGSKLAFDSILQQNAPDANYGRLFARFETRFQLIWVMGAIIPVAFSIPPRLGFFVISCAAVFAAMSYHFGVRAAADAVKRQGKVAPPGHQPLDPLPPQDPTRVVPPDPATDPTAELDPAHVPDQLELWDD